MSRMLKDLMSHIYNLSLSLSLSLSRSLTSGVFRYRFTAPGVYYYSSGYVDDANVRLLQGVVKVVAREEISSKVSVSVGGMEARHMTGKCKDVDRML